MGKITKKFEEKYYGFLFHYYRGEVYRETAWRNRLDITTNWVIVITAGMLSFVFSNKGISHTVIIVNYLIVWFLLYIEARRFRYYSLIRDRVKIFEKNILGSLFNFEKESEDSERWINEIGNKLKSPRLGMSRIESLSWRLRRVYIFIVAIVLGVWVYKVCVFPVEAGSLSQFIKNSRVGFIPGIFTDMLMLSSFIAGTVIAFYIPRKHRGDDLP